MERIFKVKVNANAKEDSIKELSTDFLKVSIKQKPLEGKANAYLMKLLSKKFGGKVEILKGKTSSLKIIKIIN